VDDIISGEDLGISGQGHQTLGPNCKTQLFDTSF